ncbi:MAG TPA: GNAT family N-acetyltransferase [Anaerolineales bacterium]
MKINPKELEVIHNESEKRFEIWLDGYLSELNYRLQGNTMIIYHTGVPSQLEGQGIAGRLTQIALDYAEEKSLNVVPLCSYAAAYIRRHPQYQKLVKE